MFAETSWTAGVVALAAVDPGEDMASVSFVPSWGNLMVKPPSPDCVGTPFVAAAGVAEGEPFVPGGNETCGDRIGAEVALSAVSSGFAGAVEGTETCGVDERFTEASACWTTAGDAFCD